MRTLLLLIALTSTSASAITGEVIHDGVCGKNNELIVKTHDYYVLMSRDTGIFLSKGDTVSGDLHSTGYVDVESRGDSGVYYVTGHQPKKLDLIKKHFEKSCVKEFR